MGKTTEFLTLLLFVLVWFIFCYQFFIKGLVPAPLDFLTNFYGPWQTYQAFPIKNPQIPDVVSQILPWKIFTIDNLKQGIIPFWNPYNFSGTPQLANWQVAPFNPFNFLFFIFPFDKAWAIYILFQPLIAGFFTLIFCRKIGLGKIASLVSSLAFAYSGFMTVWLEYGTLGWAITWLPLTLFLLELLWEKRRIILIIPLSFAYSFSILSGHLQISLYLVLANFLYSLYAFWSKKINKTYFFLSISILILPFLLTAFQIFPTLEYYLASQRNQKIALDWFKGLRIPVYYLLTFIFPDFYGNPTTRNEWTRGSYVEMMGYIGFLPILLVFFFLLFKTRKKGNFFILLSIITLLFILPTPISDLLIILKIPVLSSSAPSRMISLLSFSLSILAGLGWDKFFKFLKEKNSKTLAFLNTILVIFLLMLFSLFFINKIAFRNMIIASIIYLIFFILSYLFYSAVPMSIGTKKTADPAKCGGGRHFLRINNKGILFKAIKGVFLILIIFDLFYFWHKFNTFSSSKAFYPSLALIDFLKQNAGISRVYGTLSDNLNLPFKIYTIGGYDPLNVLAYQELIVSSKEGTTDLPVRTVGEDIDKKGKYAKKILDLLGVKYVIVGKSDVFAFPVRSFGDTFKNVWEDRYFAVFENLKVQPRFYLSQNYKVISKDKFLDQTLNSTEEKTIILIEDPKISGEATKDSQVNLESYSPNKSSFRTSSDKENLLFLSDVYYPGWQATVDGKNTPILKANYIFKAVKVTSGEHLVEFKYFPESFKIGMYVSTFTFLLIIIFPFFLKIKQNESSTF